MPTPRTPPKFRTPPPLSLKTRSASSNGLRDGVATARAYKELRHLPFAVTFGLILPTASAVNMETAQLPFFAATVFFLLAGAGATLPPLSLLVLIFTILPLASGIRLGDAGVTIVPILLVLFVVKATFLRIRIPPAGLLLAGLLASISMVNTTARYASPFIGLEFFAVLAAVSLGVAKLRESGLVIRQRFSVVAGMAFIAGVMASIGIGLVFPDAAKQMSGNEASIGDFSYRFFGISTSWELAQYCLTALALLLAITATRPSLILLTIPVAMTLIGALVFTGTYSALPGLVLLLIVWVVIVRAGIFFKIILSPIVVLLGILGLKFLSNTMIAIRGTFISDNGRFELWAFYFQLFVRDPQSMLFGSGANSVSVIARQANTAGTHNIFLDALVQFGLIGSVLLILSLIILLKGVELNPFRNAYILGWWAMASTLLTQSSIGNNTFFLLLLLAINHQNPGAHPPHPPDRVETRAPLADGSVR